MWQNIHIYIYILFVKHDANKVLQSASYNYLILPIAFMGYNPNVYDYYTFISEFRSKLYIEIYLFTPTNIMPCLAGLYNCS